MSKDQFSWTQWLGFRKSFDFTKARILGEVLGIFASIFVLMLACIAVVGLVLILTTLLGAGPYVNDPTGSAIRNIGLVSAAILGFPFIVWRSVVAQRNTAIAEQSQITDRINKAVQGLGTEKTVKIVFEKTKYKKDENGDWLQDDAGNPIPAIRPDGSPLVEREQYEETQPNIEVRVGAVLSLERISRDSGRDVEHIMGILDTYVRENTKRKDHTPSKLLSETAKIREDIQAAVSVVCQTKGRLKVGRSIKHESRVFRPDFTDVMLDGIRAANSNFNGIVLDGSSWVGADLGFSSFQNAVTTEGCNFSDTELEYCDFSHAHLTKVIFSQSTGLLDNSFRSAYLSNINFSAAKEITALDFSRSSLHGCSFDRCWVHDSKFNLASLPSTSFYQASLYKVDFDGATGWSQSMFDQAFGIKSGEGFTRLPSGASYPDHWIDLSQLGEEFDAHATFEHEYTEWKKSLFAKPV